MLHERQRRALLAALSHLMRLKYLLLLEGHDSISKQAHVSLTEVNMHGTRMAHIVVRHVSDPCIAEHRGSTALQRSDPSCYSGYIFYMRQISMFISTTMLTRV